MIAPLPRSLTASYLQVCHIRNPGLNPIVPPVFTRTKSRLRNRTLVHPKSSRSVLESGNIIGTGLDAAGGPSLEAARLDLDSQRRLRILFNLENKFDISSSLNCCLWVATPEHWPSASRKIHKASVQWTLQDPLRVNIVAVALGLCARIDESTLINPQHIKLL